MKIRAVFFDVGGVILRTEYQAPREHLAERLNLTYEDIDALVFGSESSRKASVGAISAEEHWKNIARKVKHPVEQWQTMREEFFAGDVADRDILAFLDSMRPQINTCVISNAWNDMREYLTLNRIKESFDELIISGEVGFAKPDARIYQLALDKMGVQAEQAAFVDDTPANVEAARSLGMQGLVFSDTPQLLKGLKEILK